jgi:putative transcriptional regulator
LDNLVASTKDAPTSLGSKKEAKVHFMDEPNPKEVSERLGLTQKAFARLLYISVKTLQNWEQGRREPTGAATRLLQVADKHPEVLLELVT